VQSRFKHPHNVNDNDMPLSIKPLTKSQRNIQICGSNHTVALFLCEYYLLIFKQRLKEKVEIESNLEQYYH